MNSAKKEALEILSSPDFFRLLRRVICDVGLPGEEELGTGVFFVATSHFQSYPLRLRIQEKTRGTAAYLVKKVTKLLPPDSIITVDISQNQDWKQFRAAADHSVIYFPKLETELAADEYRRLEVQQDQFIRLKGVKEDERFVEEKIEDSEVTDGAFACITSEYFAERKTRTRWLTMKQPDQRGAVPVSKQPITQKTIDVWHEIQQLLEKRAELPIAFPMWEQVAIEMMCEKDEHAAIYVPTLLQSWRTMCLLRSFVSQKERTSITTSFNDFAATVLLAKRLFKEGRYFPSTKKLYVKIMPVGMRDAVLHPITGKNICYEHKRIVKPFRNLLGLIE